LAENRPWATLDFTVSTAKGTNDQYLALGSHNHEMEIKQDIGDDDWPLIVSKYFMITVVEQ
jgi:hypothetical protein